MKFVNRHPIVSFFIIVFAISWFPQFFGARISEDITPGVVVAAVFFLLGPVIAGLIVLWAGGRSAWYGWLQRILHFRVGLHWYAVALLLPALIGLSAAYLYSLFNGTQFEITPIDISVGEILIIAGVTVLGGPLFEELFGWRGVLLPKMLESSNALMRKPIVASVIIGIPWGFWHYGLDMPSLEMMVYGSLTTTCISIIMTWIYLGTGGSTLLAGICVHFSINFWEVIQSRMFESLDLMGLRWSMMAVLGALTLIIILTNRRSLFGDGQIPKTEGTAIA